MRRDALNTKLGMQAAQPLYKQVERQILDCLARGEWKPGERIPTETQLAERFGVAVFTIRAGIGDLVAANILVRKQGKGTFVARHDRQRQRYQFTHLFRNDGVKILHERHLLSLTRVAAPDAQTAAHLQLTPGTRTPLLRVECLLRHETRPVATMSIMLPARLFVGMTARAIRESDENLYAVYQKVCGVNVIRIKEQVHAVRAGARMARVLGIGADDPVLRVDRVAYTYNDVPVEFRRRVHEAANHHYQIVEGGI